MEGLKVCRRTICGLVPSADRAIVKSVASFEKKGGNDGLDLGIARNEGTAITEHGWEATVVEYLAGRADSNDNALSLIYIFKKPQQSSVGTEAKDIGITGIAYRQVDSGYGFVTVAWKARIENQTDETGRFTVEAVFIDKDEFELAQDRKYDIILRSGESRTVTGSLTIKSNVFRQIANMIIKVRG